MRILHVSYHDGCKKNIQSVCNNLGYDLTTMGADWNYNVGHDRANEIFSRHSEFFDSFDVIITSDTAPLSRIFLQNKFKKLIIWVCNRFDYADHATNDCGFPDNEYYELFQKVTQNPNVKIFSYTQFEHVYAKRKGIDWNEKSIRPCCLESPEQVPESNLFLSPPYHNDRLFFEHIKHLPVHHGRYSGPSELQKFKGVIHIPYAWSNLALFEAWALGVVYYIPSLEFMEELCRAKNFFWSPPFQFEDIENSEWYLPQNQGNFVFFRSWKHLEAIIEAEDIRDDRKKNINSFTKMHNFITLGQWRTAINEWNHKTG